MTAAIIGMGLIGGSMSLVLKRSNFVTRVIGIENNEQHAQKAIALGLADEVMELDEALKHAQLIIIATPVDAAEILLPQLLDKITHQVVMDVGSIKNAVLQLIRHHSKKGRFVATHPMWGTEYSGPEAAVQDAFAGKATVICNKEDCDDDALELVKKIYGFLQMHIVYMNAEEHDMHVAYVSHISHITSFALANTVLEKEREEGAIFELASGGFESTVRLAKSNAAMWVPVLMQNRENVLDVLNEHIAQLKKFKACLEKENSVYLEELIVRANGISKII
ncbi:MAG: prephenate dehydrogenase [Bacteroidota bacterium]